LLRSGRRRNCTHLSADRIDAQMVFAVSKWTRPQAEGVADQGSRG
jgi:hypothetical protein